MKKLKWLKTLLLLPLLIFLLIILLFIISPTINNITASNISNEIWDTPVPNNTEQLEKISLAGKFVGAGNGMQFFGAVLIESDCTLEELQAYYSANSPIDENFIIKEQTTNKITEIENQTTVFNSWSEDGNYFIVYSWGKGVIPFYDFDLRGH